MIRKSGTGSPKKITLNRELKRDDDSKTSCRAFALVSGSERCARLHRDLCAGIPAKRHRHHAAHELPLAARLEFRLQAHRPWSRWTAPRLISWPSRRFGVVTIAS